MEILSNCTLDHPPDNKWCHEESPIGSSKISLSFYRRAVISEFLPLFSQLTENPIAPRSVAPSARKSRSPPLCLHLLSDRDLSLLESAVREDSLWSNQRLRFQRC